MIPQAQLAIQDRKYAHALTLLYQHLSKSDEQLDLIARCILQILKIDEFSLSSTLPALLQDEPSNRTLRMIAGSMLRCIQIAEENGLSIGTLPDNHHQVDFEITIQQDQPHLQIYARQSQEEEGLSKEQTRALMEEYLSILSSGDHNTLHNMAAKLSQLGEYEKSNDCLERGMAVAGEPDARALNMLGTNHFYLGDFEQAIAYYLLAKDAGAHVSIVEYNVWEAAGEILKRRPEERPRWTALYTEHFPDAKRPL